MEKMKTYGKCTCYLSILIFLLIKFGFKVESYLDAISYSVTTIVAIISLYCTLLWKYNPLEKYPRLNNKYKGVIKTENYGERYVEVKIKHNLISTYIKMISSESISKSKSFNIYKDGEDWKLIYTYINEPNILERTHSNIHYGTCVLDITNKERLKGNYYTDRKTIGEIELNTNFQQNEEKVELKN